VYKPMLSISSAMNRCFLTTAHYSDSRSDIYQELTRTTMTSDIDDRTMHELYLWPFADSVRANVASVMCSYNKLNSTWACENDKVLNGVLKRELDFKGYVMRY
jgi:beta-glucosidase-like glycosyl hydrolase